MPLAIRTPVRAPVVVDAAARAVLWRVADAVDLAGLAAADAAADSAGLAADAAEP